MKKGKDMAMENGSTRAIWNAVMRYGEFDRMPLMREGGYIPLPDHLITPDTPLEDYR